MAQKQLPPYTSNKPNYKPVDNVDNFVDTLRKSGITTIALDTETYHNPENRHAVIRYINGAPNNEPFCVTIYDGITGYYIYKDLQKLQPLLADTKIDKILHNSKYDMHMLRNIGLDMHGKIWDTMIIMHLINEEHECRMPDGKTKRSKALKNLAYHFLGEDAHELEDLVDDYRKILATNQGKKKDEISYLAVAEANVDLMKDYACADTDFTYKIFNILYPQIAVQELQIAYQTDFNATLEVLETERNGIKTDVQYYTELNESLALEMESIKSHIYNVTGYAFNIQSAAELVEAFSSLGVEWKWRTEKGELKTDDKTLTSLTRIGDDKVTDFVNTILSYRDKAKTKDTFVKNMLEYTQPDGRIHPNFNVCPNDFDHGGTVTGRLSSSDPNFQNIPKGDDRIRKGIIVDHEYILVEVDADQEEYRVLAHYANDPVFKQFVKDGKDVHTATASLIYNTPYEVIAEEVRKKEHGEAYDKHIADMRKKAKTVNFGLVYGLGLASFAVALGLKIDEPLYKKATFLIMGKNLKPWDMPDEETLKAMFAGKPDDEEAIAYYISAEAREAIKGASEIKEKYFAQFPDIKNFLKECATRTKSRGWVKTWTGRRRHFKNPSQEAYKAPNALIQGGCGDILKTKLYELGVFLRSKNAKTKIINTVHDSINFEMHKTEIHLLHEIMRILCDLPFRVPVSWGLEYSTTNWANLHKATIEEIEEVVNNGK
jgi:DNA polymerase I